MNNGQLQPKETNKVPAIILAILGLLYGVSPVDVLPDVVPFGGWIDDLVITGGGLLNLAQAYTQDTSRSLAKIIGLAKWLILILGGILIIILALFGIVVYKLLA